MDPIGLDIVDMVGFEARQLAERENHDYLTALAIVEARQGA